MLTVEKIFKLRELAKPYMKEPGDYLTFNEHEGNLDGQLITRHGKSNYIYDPQEDEWIFHNFESHYNFER